MTEIPDHPTCTQLLQQLHVPRKDESDQPALYENIVFQKAEYQKDIQLYNYDTNVLERLQPATTEEFDIHCDSIDNLGDLHTISHSEVLKIEKNTRE